MVEQCRFHRKWKSDRQAGQAVLEYILMLSLVVMGFMLLSKALVRMKFAEMMMRPISDTYAKAYRYGHPKGKGFDDGGPENHVRAVGGNNFRLFLNPK